MNTSDKMIKIRKTRYSSKVKIHKDTVSNMQRSQKYKGPRVPYQSSYVMNKIKVLSRQRSTRAKNDVTIQKNEFQP